MKNPLLICGLAAALLLPTLGHSQTEVVYREIFARPTGSSGPASMSGYNWYAHRTADATQVTNHLGSTNLQWAVSAATGSPSNLDGVNSNQTTTDTALGFGFFFSNQTAAPTLLWTDEYSVSLADITRFDWQQGNSAATETLQLAIRVGSDWYVSDQSNTNAAVSTFSTQAEQKTQLMAGSEWSSLTFTPGSALSIGSTATLPLSGTVTAFGLFSASHTAFTTLRFDTFTITATPIPEPSSIGLLLGGVVMLTGVSRRRRTVQA